MDLKKSLILLVFLPIVLCLDEEEVKEKKCFELNNSEVEIDYEWVLSHQRWYYPLMSKLDLYRTASDTLQKDVKSITPQELEMPCIYANWEGMTPSVLGFKRRLDYDLFPGWDNSFTFGAGWRKGAGGKMHLALTDNKNFLLIIKCWDDDTVSWNVMSTSRTLGEEAKLKILGSLESYELSKNLMYEQNYEGCEIEHIEGKTEL